MNYVIEVADLFLARCRNIAIISPMDYTIIAEWEKQGIPREVVLKSINQFCDELSEDGAKIESIGDFQDTVEQNFIDWLKTSDN